LNQPVLNLKQQKTAMGCLRLKCEGDNEGGGETVSLSPTFKRTGKQRKRVGDRAGLGGGGRKEQTLGKGAQVAALGKKERNEQERENKRKGLRRRLTREGTWGIIADL